VDDDWNEEPDPGTIRSIIARCQEMEPGLAEAQIISSYVGLQPGRGVIRFEPEIIGGGQFLFHNYGHGGSRCTVSWGCAQELRQILSRTCWSGNSYSQFFPHPFSPAFPKDVDYCCP
jgi:D-amino-acid oxidase